MHTRFPSKIGFPYVFFVFECFVSYQRRSSFMLDISLQKGKTDRTTKRKEQGHQFSFVNPPADR